MSVKAMTWAFAQDLKPGPKLVLLALADRANEDGQCWPSVPHLAVKCSMSDRAIQRAVALLVRAGLLAIEEQFMPGTKAKKTNRYQLSVDSVTTMARGGGDNLSPRPGDNLTPLGDASVTTLVTPETPPPIEPSREPSERRKRPAPLGLVVSWRVGFEQVWECYPNKVGRGAAEKAYRKINPDPVLLQTILEQIAAAKQTRQWQKDNGEFICHLSTWLNQSRWKDVYTPVAEEPARSLVDFASRGMR